MIRLVLRTLFPLCLLSCVLLPLLFAQTPSTRIAATDIHGDPLPPHALARIGTTRLRHGAYPSSLAFSPDGKRISAATLWFDVAVWDAQNGQTIAFRSRCREKGLFGATVSPDGSLFAGRLEKGKLGVQQALDGKIIHSFESEKEICEGLVFSRDNRWLASADREGKTLLWDLRVGQLARQFQAKPRETYDNFVHAFTPDGSIFIQARRDGITFWSVHTGKEIRRIDSRSEREWPAGAAVSPDGNTLAIHIAYGRIDLFEIQTGRHVRELAHGFNEVGPVFSPDGKYVLTGRNSGEIDFWDVQTGQRARTLTLAKEAHPKSLAISPDGNLLACGGSDHAIHLFDLSSGNELLPVRNRLGGKPSVRFLPDGKTLAVHCQYEQNQMSANINPLLSFWNLEGQFLRQAPFDPGTAHALALSADLRTIAYGAGPHFGLLGRPIPNGFLKSCLWLCDLASGKLLVKVNEMTCQIEEMAFSPDQRFLFVKAFNAGPNEEDFERFDTLQVWKRKSPATLEKVADIPILKFLSGYSVSPDSQWIGVTTQEGYRFYDCETGKLNRIHADTPGSIAAVSPSGRVLISRDAEDVRSGEEVLVWEKATGKTICTLTCESGQTDYSPLVVSPDGKVVAGCLDGEVIALWDLFTGKLLAKLPGHRGDVESLTFSPDGRMLVSASADTTILIWDYKLALPGHSQIAPFSAERLEQLWQDLQSSDARRAYLAIGSLVQSPPQATDLLSKKLALAQNADGARYEQWIAQLGSDSFPLRESASKQLADAGELAESALRQALTNPQSLEGRSRMADLLDRLPSAPLHSSTLTTIRCMEVLQLINSPQARSLIRELSQKKDDPIRRREAEQSLMRLDG